MLFNDLFFIEIFLILFILFYLNTVNITTLFYIGGLYLVFLGLLGLISGGDIFIGFLWVIDLGVGLVLFIFILYFTSFLYQKSFLDINYKFYFFILFYILFLFYFIYFNFLNYYTYSLNLKSTWVFKVSYIDYYHLMNNYEISDLNLMKDIYFLSTGFEFFLINFSLLYGLLVSILMYFLFTKFFLYYYEYQILNFNFLKYSDSSFFLRNQNYNKQQNVIPSVNTWIKFK